MSENKKNNKKDVKTEEQQKNDFVESQKDNYEELAKKVIQMSDNEIKQLDKATSSEIRYIKDNLNTASVLAGRTIPKKSYDRIKDKKEVKKNRRNLTERDIEYYDQKNKEIKKRTVIVHIGAEACRNVTSEIATSQEIERVVKTLLPYEKRISNGCGHRDSVSAIRRAIKEVKQERLETELNQKKVKSLNIAKFGKELIKRKLELAEKSEKS